MKNGTIWWIILIIIIILGAYFLFTSNKNVNIDNQENIIPTEETNADTNGDLKENATEPLDNVSENSEGSATQEGIPVSQ